MPVTIRLFATLKEHAGQRRLSVPIEPPLTVAPLLDQIERSSPNVPPGHPNGPCRRQQSICIAENIIQPGDDVALFPPVSGGETRRIQPSSPLAARRRT